MTTNYEKINNEVTKFNNLLALLPQSTKLNLFIQFNENILKLLKQLTRDKIGLELLNALEKKLKENSDTSKYIEQLHCLLLEYENNFVNQQARKKYVLGAKGFYDLISWVQYGNIIGLLTGLAVFEILVLCLMITPAPAHLVLIGVGLITVGCINILCDHIVRPQAGKLHDQLFDLQKEHTKLLTDFDQLFTTDEQKSSLTDEEKEHLSEKSIKFYDSSDYYTRKLNDGYHYEYSYLGSPSLYFSCAGEMTRLYIKDKQKFNAELIRIRQAHRGSSYDLSSAQIKALITDNIYVQYSPDSEAEHPLDKPLFESALRIKKLRFFHQELNKEIQDKSNSNHQLPIAPDL